MSEAGDPGMPLVGAARTEETPELMDLGYLSTDFDALWSAP